MKHRLTFPACLSIFSSSIVLSIHYCDWGLAQRSGTLIVAVGLLLESWKLITTSDPGEMPMWSTKEAHSALRASVAVIVIGTLIQGYADLIVKAILGDQMGICV